MTDDDTAALRVQLLGPVRAWRSDEELNLGGPRPRAVIGMLAVSSRRVVSRGELIDGIWGTEPPASAVNSVHVYVAGLRRVLEPGRARRAPGQVLTADGPGYRLRLEPGTLDAEALDGHIADARRQAAGGDPAAAARSMEAALALWHGDSLAGIPGPWADVERARLEELRKVVIGDRIDVLLEMGGHRQAVAELAALIRQYPLHERFHAQLMLALYWSGRQAEALDAFTRARGTLAGQLGIDPGPELRRLHQRILTADPALDPPLPHGPAPGTARRPPPLRPPRELPPDVDTFTGRAAELAALDRLLTPGPAGSHRAAPAVAAVTGTAGVGKTALAVRWGHRAREAFPDGQLYVDLRGYDPGERMSPADALAGFLRSLGVDDQDIPVDPAGRAASYRSLLDGRRMVVVLDNAGTVDQVRPLLPGTASCSVLVTSRESLAGLVARHGAVRIDLGTLPAGDAMALLQDLIGARAAADPAAAATLAGQCARLPLALRVAAELAAARPATDLAQLTGELSDERRRLHLLDAGGDPRTAVRAVFSWSYRHLPADAARAFRLSGLHPGPDFDALAAAALAGCTAEVAGDLLWQLARASLVQAAGPGRYHMHDLLRAYAAGLAGEDPDAETAQTRLFDYYLAAASAAMNTLVPAEEAYRPAVVPPGTPLPAMADPEAARGWLDAERAVLVRLTGHAADQGRPAYATRLSTVLWRYLGTGYYTDAVTVHTHARRAARKAGDRPAEAYALNFLGIIDGRLGRYSQASASLTRALALFRENGDRLGESFALINLASGHWRQGRYQQASAHAERALALLRDIGDRRGEAHALNTLGLVNWRQGDFPRAAGHFRRARILYRDAGDRSNEAHALGNLGMVTGRWGRYPEAAGCLGRALAMFRELGYRTGEASTLTDLGWVACQQGRHREAALYHEQALVLFRELGERSGEAEALNGLGEATLAAGQPRQARAYHAAALALAGQIGDRYEEARARTGLDEVSARATPGIAGSRPVVPAGTPSPPVNRG